MTTGEQSTQNDVLKSKNIASLRIHVERAIERIRQFRFLDIHRNYVDHNHLGLLDDIVIIAAGSINMQQRLIRQ